MPAAATGWTNWTSGSLGDRDGWVSGTMGSTTANYTGEVISGTIIDGAGSYYWMSETTIIGGVVDSSPASVGDIIALYGQYMGTKYYRIFFARS